MKQNSNISGHWVVVNVNNLIRFPILVQFKQNTARFKLESDFEFLHLIIDVK